MYPYYDVSASGLGRIAAATVDESSTAAVLATAHAGRCTAGQAVYRWYQTVGRGADEAMENRENRQANNNVVRQKTPDNTIKHGIM